LTGNNCKTGKCYYHIFRGSYICGASQLKPFLALTLFLIALNIFGALQ
jgi:hypothetical protein